MDDLTLGVLLGAEGDDGGLTTAGVGAELGVDVGLDDLGHRLGLKEEEWGGRDVRYGALPAEKAIGFRKIFGQMANPEGHRKGRRGTRVDWGKHVPGPWTP